MKVEFGEPDHGWMTIEVTVEDSTVAIDASYVYPSVEQLAEALVLLAKTATERIVVWLLEPGEIEMRFASGTTGRVSLELWEFRDHRRAANSGEFRLGTTGDFTTVCVPFVLARRDLQVRYGPTDWESRWTPPFPVEDVTRLSEIIRDR